MPRVARPAGRRVAPALVIGAFYRGSLPATCPSSSQERVVVPRRYWAGWGTDVGDAVVSPIRTGDGSSTRGSSPYCPIPLPALVEPEQLLVCTIPSSTSLGTLRTPVLSVLAEKGFLRRLDLLPGVSTCGGSALPMLESHRHRPNSGFNVTTYEQAMLMSTSIITYRPLGMLP